MSCSPGTPISPVSIAVDKDPSFKFPGSLISGMGIPEVESCGTATTLFFCNGPLLNRLFGPWRGRGAPTLVGAASPPVCVVVEEALRRFLSNNLASIAAGGAGSDVTGVSNPSDFPLSIPSACTGVTPFLTGSIVVSDVVVSFSLGGSGFPAGARSTRLVGGALRERKKLRFRTLESGASIVEDMVPATGIGDTMVFWTGRGSPCAPSESNSS